MKRVAVVGLVLFAAVAAQAPVQAQVVGPPAPKAAPAETLGCSLSSKVGEQYVERPLPGFDTSAAILPIPQANSGASMVICNRASIVPQVTDYRVLTEMHLPLAIHAGGKTLFVVASKGKLQVAAPDGELPPEDVAQIRPRIDEMQAAMAKAGVK